MTYKLSVLTTLSAFVVTFFSFSAYSQENDCDKSHYDAMRCQSDRLKNLDDELNRVYKLALEARPEKVDTDIRKEREQLRKSQRAWLVYYHEQCTLEGGLDGGSNSWVTSFAMDCEEKELAHRIKFLKSVADGVNGEVEGRE